MCERECVRACVCVCVCEGKRGRERIGGDTQIHRKAAMDLVKGVLGRVLAQHYNAVWVALLALLALHSGQPAPHSPHPLICKTVTSFLSCRDQTRSSILYLEVHLELQRSLQKLKNIVQQMAGELCSLTVLVANAGYACPSVG